MTRFEKLEYLQDMFHSDSQSASKRQLLIDEMVMFMSDEYFDQFFQHVCSCYDVSYPVDYQPVKHTAWS